MQSKLENWKAGIDHFNSGRYWEAHEAWERDWLTLPREEKLHIQILIQLAGVLFLIEKERVSGARSLLETALAKMVLLNELGGVSEIFPRVEILDLEMGLTELEELLRTSGPYKGIKFARARLLLSPLDALC
jgi:Domain of unknown function (DUF309)